MLLVYYRSWWLIRDLSGNAQSNPTHLLQPRGSKLIAKLRVAVGRIQIKLKYVISLSMTSHSGLEWNGIEKLMLDPQLL